MSTPGIATIERSELAKVAEIQPGAVPTNPMAVLQFALANNADIDKITKFVEWYEKRNAEKAYVAALAAFKKNPIKIEKNRKVSYEAKGQTVSYKHATLDRVTAALAVGLGAHGLFANWETEQPNGKIKVTCVLSHELGHSTRTTLEAPPDDTGSKNAVQAIKSTLTYLERATLEAATGTAEADDSDGITFADVEEVLASIASAITLDELQDRYNKAYKRAFAAKDKAHMAIVIEAKENRKKELLAKNPKAEEQMQEFSKLAEAAGMNTAARNMLLGKHGGNLEAAIAEIKVAPTTPRQPALEQASGAGGTGETGETRRSAKRGGQRQAEPAGTGQNQAAEPAPASKDSGPDQTLGF